MKINLDPEKEAMLDEFAQVEKPGAVKDRLAAIQSAIQDAGFNLGTRTTNAALLGLVYGVSEDEVVDEDDNQIRYFIEEVKPNEVKNRVAKIKALFDSNGINMTRTTMAACQLIADDFHL